MSGVNNRSGALALITDDHILSRISQGENPSRIATDLGVHKSAIYHRYSKDKPGNQEYIDARFDGQQVRVEEGELDIREATDQFTLSRAREVFRAVSWRAEREFPKVWGLKQEITQLNLNVDLPPETLGKLSDLIARAKAIDAEVIEIVPEKP